MSMLSTPPNQRQSPGPSPLQADSTGWVQMLARLGPLIGLLFVVSIFAVKVPRTFLTVGNFELILRQTAVVGTAALGMTLIIIAGGIDLSAGSAVALVTVTIGLLLPHDVSDPITGARITTVGWHPLIALLGGIGVGTLCGLVTGSLVTRLKLVPFIITLGMMTFLRGLSQRLADNTIVYPRPTWLSTLLLPFDTQRIWLLTPGVWLMVFLAILIAAMLRYTRFGRHIFAIGSNEQTARLCGVPVERTKLMIYTLGAALVAVAGVLQFSYLTVGDPTTAIGMELDIIAAVVIGGASLNGGQGTITGSLIGALIMAVVANGCSKVGLHNSDQLMVTGGIIILAVALDRLRQRRVS